MRERTVGRSGLVVGEIGLGTLTWGRDTNEDEARGQVQALLDAGGNLIDTSPAFGHGAAETLVGKLTTHEFPRQQLVLCTRAGFTRGPNGLRFGAGRGSIQDSVNDSLERLATDYVDVLLLGAPDPIASDEETATALAKLVTSGTVRYIGIMGYPAWRAAILQQLLKERHLPSLSVIETEYSLLARECEDQLLPFAEYCGLGTFAASPLGRGVLTGKYRRSIPPTSRAASEHLSAFVEPYLRDRQRRVVEALARAADGLGRSLSDVALSWTLRNPAISSALVGARTAAQFTSALASGEALPELVAAALDDVTD
ncbi:aldo/keto reductase [Changpingibacter yushuensis]|uniref:aldo/keto reductase n=1 Tax=Changpingibacter yushuensis TaxID=2758440 RepID=UPI0015F5290B|nr:aldo/keto reductase [Changpingibacter yushuensis]